MLSQRHPQRFSWKKDDTFLKKLKSIRRQEQNYFKMRMRDAGHTAEGLRETEGQMVILCSSEKHLTRHWTLSQSTDITSNR